MAPKQLILGLVQQCPILIFISRINLWSYFPFLPLPFLSYLLYSKNLIISPRSSAPLTFTPNVCELCCILRCCSCCQPWYPTRLMGNLVISFSFQQPGLGEPLHPPNPHLASPKSTPGIPQIHTWLSQHSKGGWHPELHLCSDGTRASPAN